MKLLFITPFFRVPADFGIGIRNFQILKHLTERHEVTVITYGEDETGETDAWLHNRGAKVVRLPYSFPWSSDKSRRGALRNLFYYPPASFQRFSPEQLADAVTRCLNKDPEVDLIMFDTQLAGQAALGTNFAIPHVLIVHDIYEVLLHREFQIAGWQMHKIVRLVDWLKNRHYERRILARYQHLIAVSSADEAFLKQSFPHAQVSLVTNGVDTERFARNGQSRDPNSILFVGGFEYPPNVDAFFYFCRAILPLIKAKRPEVKFVAAGRNPTAEMREYARGNPAISLTGAVDDIRPFYGRASAVAIPLRVGSGMKLKTLEAFSMGVPAVVTSIGCEGLEVQSGVHCTVANTADDFAKGLLELLAEPDKADQLSVRARRLAIENYDWKQITSDFDRALERVRAFEVGKAPLVSARVRRAGTSETVAPVILDIGCGRRKHAGAIGVDNAPLDTVDVVADLRSLPLPFAPESADEIILSHVLEHFTIAEIQEILNETYRVLKSDGILTVSVPHALSVAFSSDPTHITRFTFGTFHYFTPGHNFSYYRGLQSQWQIKRLWASVNLFNNLLSPVAPWKQKLEHFATRAMRYLVRRSKSQTLPDLIVKQLPFWLVNIHCSFSKAKQGH